MAQASAVKTGGGFLGGALGEVLAGVLGVLLAGSLFFAFFVQPRAQHERDRIYRAMAQVARLIDDQIEVAKLAQSIWSGSSIEENKALEDYPHLEGGCPNEPVLCVRIMGDKDEGAEEQANVNVPPKTDEVAEEQDTVNVPLKTIAENADLPYPEAILLIMDEHGNVLAGQDRDGRWSLFHSLGTLILGGDGAGGEATEQGRKPGVSSGGEASTTRELVKMKQTIEAYQRGERNAVFSGAPARLTHSFGGQDYAVFMAAHRLSATKGAVWIGGGDSPFASGSDGAVQSRSLIYAFLVPERVIDRTATALPKSALVHLLMVIVILFLAIPMIKLFSQNALKPIRIADLAAVMLSIMLITMTATLFTTVVLFRSSVTRDIEGELAWLSNKVSQSLSKTIAARNKPLGEDEEAVKTLLFGTHQGVVARGDADALVGVTAVDADGGCLPSLEDTQKVFCGGRFFGVQPRFGKLNVAKRDYFKAWEMGLGFPGGGNYVQFLRSKGNGRLSLSAMGGKVVCPGADCGLDRRGGTPLFTFFPIALRAPVLPRNFAFMVVLNSDLPGDLTARGGVVAGDVLYHSHQARSMNENLLVEARYDPGLASALEMLRQGPPSKDGERASVRSSLLPISYQGHPHFALVRPVPDTPWSVVAIYARDEALDLLDLSVVQAFLLGCGWIVLVFLICWLLPRAMRAILLRPDPGRTQGTNRPAPPPIRGRSIWFFPNALSKGAGDGLRYSFVTGPRELIWQGGVLLLQGAVLWACAPEVAVFASCGLAVLLLCCNYLTIVRRSEDSQSERGRRHAKWVAWLRMGVAGVTLLAMALVLGLCGRIDTSDLAQAWVFLPAALAVVAIQIVRWLSLRHYQRPSAPPQQVRSGQRQAYILRTLTLLTIVVSMPMVCIMALTYSVNVEQYMGRSLAHVAAQSERQARAFQADAMRLARAKEAGGGTAKAEISLDEKKKLDELAKGLLEDWKTEFGLGTHALKNPGWLVSALPAATWCSDGVDAHGEKPIKDGEDRPEAGEERNAKVHEIEPQSQDRSTAGADTDGGGLFAVGVEAFPKCCKSADEASNEKSEAGNEKSEAGNDKSEASNDKSEVSNGEPCNIEPRSRGGLAALVERLQPRIGVSDPGVEDQANRYILTREAGRLALARPRQFQPLRAEKTSWSLEGTALISGDAEQLPLHPRWLTVLFLGLFVAFFGFAMYRLLVAVAEHLTGLYLLPVDVSSAQQLIARGKQIQSNPRTAWDALGGYPQKARLMALAHGRSINFHEREAIQDLVERGYLQLTPYVQIACEELAEYIRHDLPREERERVRNYCAQVEDKWDHVRLPIIVAYVAACVLVAYVSPNLVQLVTTSFFALAALLPLMRDPLAQFLGKRG
ncbi:hypothetical protein [Novosphingobium mangrovi (ex Hu et al. 2023)]|uniref:Uncharacterized protein n=1 Tax=Novosphingobium mangrovi (ex Hu et al. 2023) TaxID=2930094 RepID=A0ABT0AAK4_9SPHN|nr:hypothetical protein [Novosphingobium mangrovi (ex Hu et al. 2023)]MCJ1960214.1 hypothetical protein [Novosphingobium mangrovi (ex Hu et al. 2023)]